MKMILLIFITLLISVCLGWQILQDPGYLLIMYGEYSIEMPLWVGGFLILIAFILLSWSTHVFKYIAFSTQRRIKYRKKRNLNRAKKYTDQGLLALAEGHWARAEKYLTKALPYTKTPLVNYLAAARAAQESGSSKKRDEYLRYAQQHAPNANIAIALTQAQLQIGTHQLEQALATLRHLHTLEPKHPYVIKLLFKVYYDLEDWEQLRLLLPKLYKHRLIKKEEYANLELKIYMHLIKHAKLSDLSSLPKHIRKNPKILALIN